MARLEPRDRALVQDSPPAMRRGGGLAVTETIDPVDAFRDGAAGYARAHDFAEHVLDAPTKTADDLSLILMRADTADYRGKNTEI